MPDKPIRQDVLCNARSIVVKLGTHAITDESGRLDRRIINSLVRQVSEIRRSGTAVALVTSGAIGAGLAELDLAKRPRTMPMLQAVAAVGQGQLMRAFHDAFARQGIRVGQVLVTADDFEERTRYLNIRNTLAALAECRAIAIINENDAVAVDEIRFGDNDVIAALVTNLLGADVLVLLTNVDGVLEGGKVMDVIDRPEAAAEALPDAPRSRLGSGGMAGKLAAAGRVTRAGDVVVIANARMPKVLTRLLGGERLGTVCVPAGRKMSSRRRWIGLASRPEGELFVDAGAAKALRQGGKSLLPSGIVSVAGDFGKGATVSVIGPAGGEIARGLSNYAAGQIDKIKGSKTSQIARVLGDKPYDEVIHRNNMTLV